LHDAPEGSVCAAHADRPAAFTCPRCGKHVCIFCWHQVALRCEVCLQEDPASAAPPVPWESGEGSVVSRYFATLGQAFRPVFTAPGFAQSEVAAARRFFLLTALPMAALAGVIPYTTTLLFGGSLFVKLQGTPTQGDIALDVMRAAVIGLGVFALELGALGVPYTSLVKAYAPARHAAALRVLLYRAWLVPLSSLFVFAALWVLPIPMPADPKATPPPPPAYLPLIGFVQITLDALFLVAMRATARLACGLKPLLSYVVVIVPFVLWVLVQLVLGRTLTSG
jgi:hypothetical protein